MPSRHSPGRYSGQEFDASLENSEGSDLVCLTPVAIWTDGTMRKASRTSRQLSILAGLLWPDITLDGEQGGVAFTGVVTAPPAKWDAVTGASGGLTPGSIYYLGDGTLTTARPTTPGEFEVIVGYALTSETMDLRISTPKVLGGVPKTTDYTIQPEDNGTLFTTAGASGTVIFTLPTWLPGFEVGFLVGASQILEVLAPGTDVIHHGNLASGAGGNAQSSHLGNGLWVASESSGLWTTRSATGSWSVT